MTLFLKHSKREHLIRLDDQFVEIVHIRDRARLRSHETVGFHAHPSDVHIAPELIDLFLNIELFVSALLEQHAFTEHKDAHLVSFAHRHIGKPQRIVDRLRIVRRNNEKDIHLTPPFGYVLSSGTEHPTKIW